MKQTNIKYYTISFGIILLMVNCFFLRSFSPILVLLITVICGIIVGTSLIEFIKGDDIGLFEIIFKKRLK